MAMHRHRVWKAREEYESKARKMSAEHARRWADAVDSVDRYIRKKRRATSAIAHDRNRRRPEGTEKADAPGTK